MSWPGHLHEHELSCATHTIVCIFMILQYIVDNNTCSKRCKISNCSIQYSPLEILFHGHGITMGAKILCWIHLLILQLIVSSLRLFTNVTCMIYNIVGYKHVLSLVMHVPIMTSKCSLQISCVCLLFLLIHVCTAMS